MMNIIVAFPKMEHAKHIKNILVKGGFSVEAVCTSGARALQCMNELSDGIVICAAHLADMGYVELYHDLPEHFQMLLLASPQMLGMRMEEDIMCLSMPLKVHELLHTVEMMAYAVERRRKRRHAMPKRRSLEEQATIDRAKLLLQERNGLSEEEAHRYLQKCSMDSGTGLTETAQMILSMMDGS